jgi:hypothetical protein
MCEDDNVDHIQKDFLPKQSKPVNAFSVGVILNKDNTVIMEQHMMHHNGGLLIVMEMNIHYSLSRVMIGYFYHCSAFLFSSRSIHHV